MHSSHRFGAIISVKDLSRVLVAPLWISHQFSKEVQRQ